MNQIFSYTILIFYPSGSVNIEPFSGKTISFSVSNFSTGYSITISSGYVYSSGYS